MKLHLLAGTAMSVFTLVSCSTHQPGSAPPAAAGAGAGKSGVYVQNLDKSVRPQDDFYDFVNGQWLAATTIPPDRSNYGAFTLLQEGAERDLHTILEEAAASKAAPGSDEQKVGDFYASFIDEATIESRGLEPLAGELKRIEALATPKGVARYVRYGPRLFIAHPFVWFVGVDRKHSSEYIGNLYQTGLGMPDRDYYLSDDAQLKAVRDKYQAYVRDLLAAAGTPDAAAGAAKVYAIE